MVRVRERVVAACAHVLLIESHAEGRVLCSREESVLCFVAKFAVVCLKASRMTLFGELTYYSGFMMKARYLSEKGSKVK